MQNTTADRAAEAFQLTPEQRARAARMAGRRGITKDDPAYLNLLIAVRVKPDKTSSAFDLGMLDWE